MDLHGRRHAGFSLLEVLIAMLVLGVAVMAFAGLQARALGTSGDAHLREQAVSLASDFVERIRANAGEIDTYRDPKLYDGASVPAGAPTDWAGNLNCLEFSAVDTDGCSTAQMARFDINEVEFLAGQLLPDGRVQFGACENLPNLDCVVIAWRGTAPADCHDTNTPQCVAMQVTFR